AITLFCSHSIWRPTTRGLKDSPGAASGLSTVAKERSTTSMKYWKLLMDLVGLGRRAEEQVPSGFISTEYQGPFSSARNWTCARPTASTGVKQASSRGNRPASTQPTSLWSMATRPELRAADAAGVATGVGAAAGAGAAAATGRTHCAATYPSRPARVRTWYHSPARSRTVSTSSRAAVPTIALPVVGPRRTVTVIAATCTDSAWSGMARATHRTAASAARDRVRMETSREGWRQAPSPQAAQKRGESSHSAASGATVWLPGLS